MSPMILALAVQLAGPATTTTVAPRPAPAATPSNVRAAVGTRTRTNVTASRARIDNRINNRVGGGQIATPPRGTPVSPYGPRQ